MLLFALHTVIMRSSQTPGVTKADEHSLLVTAPTIEVTLGLEERRPTALLFDSVVVHISC